MGRLHLFHRRDYPLVHEDSRRRDRSTEALVAKPSPAKKKSKFRKGVFCHNCSKEGHIKPECCSKPSQSGSGAPSKDNTCAHVTEDSSDSGYAFVTLDDEITALLAKGETWLADTACQRHIVRDRSLFISYTPTKHELTGVGTSAAIGRGDVRILFGMEKGTVTIVLKDALHAPDLPYNLISLTRFTDKGLWYKGKGDQLWLMDDETVIGFRVVKSFRFNH